MNSLQWKEVALCALLVFAIPNAQAETRSFVDHAVLPMGELIEPDTWQEPLEGMLVRARERCAARANDLRVEINEVVPEESVETGIPRREAVRAFLSSRIGGQGVFVVGTLTAQQLNSRRAQHGGTNKATEHEIDVEFACSTR